MFTAFGGTFCVAWLAAFTRALYPIGYSVSETPTSELIEQHTEEFAQLESIDNGKPVSVARVADVPLSVDTFRYMAGWATKITGRTSDISMPGEWLTYSRKEPVGVVGQIIPWNFPLLMAAWKLAPALAAGNTLVLKSAEQTPLSALLLADLAWASAASPARACWRTRTSMTRSLKACPTSPAS